MPRGRGMRSRGRGRIFTVRRNFVTKRQLRNETRGVQFVPQSDPPRVLPTQWNNARLAFYGTGAKVITDKTVTDGISTQLGLNPISSFYSIFRIKEARVWLEHTPNNPLKAPLQVRFRSIFGEDFLSIQADYGGETKYARCGYRWPRNDQNATLDSKGTDYHIMEVLPTDVTQNWVVYLDILWSMQKPDTEIEALDGMMSSLRVT